MQRERISLKSFLTLPCNTVSDIYGSSSQDLESPAPISPPGFSLLTTFPREVRGVTSIVCRSDPGPGTRADFNGFIVLIVHIIFRPTLEPALSLLSPVWPRLFLLSILKMSQHSARGGEEEGGRQHTVHIQISFLLHSVG